MPQSPAFTGIATVCLPSACSRPDRASPIDRTDGYADGAAEHLHVGNVEKKRSHERFPQVRRAQRWDGVAAAVDEIMP